MNSLLAEGVTESAADAPLDVEISPTTEANTSTARLTARIRWSIETLHGEPLYEDSPIKPSRDKRTQMSTKVAGHGFRITLTAGRSRERCGRQETRSDSPPGSYLSMSSARVSSFLPRAVVVPDVRVAEEVLQDEPRVRRPLADPAVGDDLLVRRHALRLVERLQLLRRLERPVLVYGLGPGDVLRPGDVPAALRVLRRVFGRREDLARELLRPAHVDEDLPRLLVRLPDVREVDPERFVRFLRGEGRRRERRHVLRHGQVLLDPLLPPTVQEDDVVDAVVLEDPERERGEPVVE